MLVKFSWKSPISSINSIFETVHTVVCRAVTRQRLGKHVPAARDTNTTMVQQQRISILYVVCAEMLQPGRFGASSQLIGGEEKTRRLV
jgi:hypothetical protein